MGSRSQESKASRRLFLKTIFDSQMKFYSFSSYQKLREELLNLQIKLTNKTGVDPLLGSTFSSAPTVVASVMPQPKKMKDSEPPSPKPRKKKAKPGATFQSHMFEQWDQHSPLADLVRDLSANLTLVYEIQYFFNIFREY
jgi:hypothetical protein